MKKFFQPNLDTRGRLARGGIALLLFIAGGALYYQLRWLGLVFISIGVFSTFQAVRGWCIARACGVKTRL